MPGADDMTVLVELLSTLPWTAMLPAPDLLAEQPGREDARRMIVAARTEDGAAAIVYTPAEGALALRLAGLRLPLRATWVDPRTGERHAAGIIEKEEGEVSEAERRLDTPGPGDWVLVLAAASSGLDNQASGVPHP